jgi:transposase
MPTTRQSGKEVARKEAEGNARRGPNISPAERTRIMAKRQLGVAIKELAAEFGRSESAIKYTIRTYSKLTTTRDKPRSGRPPILSPRQTKLVYRKARAAPKIQYSELVKDIAFVNADGTTSKPPSRSTLHRVLKRRGLTNNRCKKVS